MAKYRLTPHNIDEVSLVPAGDNPKADIVFTKSRDGAEGSATIRTTEARENAVPIDRDKVIAGLMKSDPEVVQYVKSLEEENDGLIEKNESLVTTIEKGKGKPAFLTDKEDDDDMDDDDKKVEKLAKSDPQLAEFVKSALDRATAAEEIAKEEREIRIEAELLAKAEDYPHIAGTPEEKATLLRKAYEVDDDGTFGKALEDQWAAANEQIAKSGLFAEYGHTGSTGTDTKVDAGVASIMKSDPSLSKAEATTAYFDANPSAYDAQEG
jgi:hypothetical protein